ncbi:hypothetical protein [Bacteriovorax sp. Seq25_V]|uniref:hypothetical protein n=1 Tax=Bacteriovorax sp. Seq25_V TaxID=1201288 RepID=UPI00038A4C28|nr:hypothetical protein [Bacteriovorax sp. Seq25_V]EQC46789.1 hypothetical protein M900_2515 [Bacteriovorax sp. Seq25_V]
MAEQITIISYYMNEVASVVELDNGTWKYIRLPNNVYDLSLKDSRTEIINGNEINVRVFENAELRFDKDFAKFQHLDSGHILMNSDVNSVPAEIKAMLK